MREKKKKKKNSLISLAKVWGKGGLTTETLFDNTPTIATQYQGETTPWIPRLTMPNKKLDLPFCSVEAGSALQFSCCRQS
jgi:hypothetical protein